MRVALFLGLLIVGGAAGAADSYALIGVNVLPMDEERTLHGQTILIRDGRIAAVGPSTDVVIPPEAIVLDGGGRWVMPGLIDMHVHMRKADGPAYIAAGVTSVRNMWGHPAVAALIASGPDELMPEIYSASQGVNGPNPVWPYAVVITDPKRASAVVDEQKRAGWRFIKLYVNLSRDVYDALVDAAHARGMKAVGHVSVDIHHALLKGQNSIEHFNGYDRALSSRGGLFAWIDADERKLADLARRTREAGTWNCPTLDLMRVLNGGRLSPADMQGILKGRRRFVKALRDAGAPLLAGTDSGIGATVPGSSLPDEIAELVAAGLTPYEAIAAATSAAAEFLDAGGEIGVIAEGSRADVLLLDRNPLDDLVTLRRPAAVFLRGKLVHDARTGSTRRRIAVP
ncbi:MAG TPA: amidohydrolase family protein [Thermoanaerobaculia bacterium]|nr:amidohydrolase family protein [Thermoanaerobaculia bacterium]